ncbi:MAG: alcohol dehydrogenase catalytic domain-containing protein [Candidatus Lokiarchaeota archaeon]|nr:alcohol dehydrogenase catalytic domain-containing protein [Candidatus Lokiarchaeota archaeon]MBD3339048.1 alcohol dehydrogenase catalytic domain-containing protein [Candidatus Lokiarchaeota archaeon]
MKGAVFEGKGNVIVKNDLPKPEIKLDEVLIKTKYCGICGSGIESFKSGGMYIPGIILGHELSGEIAEVGEHVKKIKIGDRVTVNPNVPCGDCYWCDRNQENMCKLSNNGIGTTQNGGMADFISVKAERIHHLSDSMSMKAGATVEPLANCVYAVQESGFKLGDNATVFGAGSIGLMMIQALKAAGASQIFVIEPVKFKQKLALNLGADKAFDPKKWNKITRLTDRIGPDHIFDCVGIPDSLMTSINLIKRGGHITLVGIHVESFEMKGLMQIPLKNISLRGTFAFNQEVFSTAVKLIANKRVDGEKIVSKVVPLEEVPKMYETLANPPHEEIKVLVDLE